VSHVPSPRSVLSPPDRRIAGWLLLAIAALVLAAGLSMGTPSSADARPRLVACENNLDDDGDGKVDNYDPGCQNGRDDTEANPASPAQCSDGADNEPAVPPATVPGDGKIDLADPGCPFAGNNNEADPAGATPQCADGIDNDLDGKTDFPANPPILTQIPDPDCSWGADNMEVTRACSDGSDNDLDGKIDWPADLGCPGPNNNNEADFPQCNDGRDNDGDGKVDTDAANPPDPGCSSPTDNDETDPPPAPAVCSDGKDNDGDGKIDFPADPGCASAADSDEVDPPPGLPQTAPASCADGRDNDGDGRIDFPADPGCITAADDDEGPLSVLLPSSTGPQHVLAPFPVVRLRGRIARTSARITLLTVTAPSGSKVSIYCAGRSCPRKRLAVTAGRKAVRVRRFERRLRAGTVLRIYVTKPGFVGKYTRFQIRRGRSPLRTDLCAQTPAATPRRCPAS
jgi:hypothetical protein